MADASPDTGSDSERQQRAALQAATHARQRAIAQIPAHCLLEPASAVGVIQRHLLDQDWAAGLRALCRRLADHPVAGPALCMHGFPSAVACAAADFLDHTSLEDAAIEAQIDAVEGAMAAEGNVTPVSVAPLLAGVCAGLRPFRRAVIPGICKLFPATGTAGVPASDAAAAATAAAAAAAAAHAAAGGTGHGTASGAAKAAAAAAAAAAVGSADPELEAERSDTEDDPLRARLTLSLTDVQALLLDADFVQCVAHAKAGDSAKLIALLSAEVDLTTAAPARRRRRGGSSSRPSCTASRPSAAKSLTGVHCSSTSCACAKSLVRPPAYCSRSCPGTHPTPCTSHACRR